PLLFSITKLPIYPILEFPNRLFLLPRCPLLRRLQRIKRGCTGEAAPLSGRLLGFQDHYVSVPVAGNCTLDQEQVFFSIDAANLEIADCYLVHAHVPRHTHSRKNARRE